jgi:hypothetical protein
MSDETRTRRERSARYPGVPLNDGIELCGFMESRGLDGLSASDIATALGYRNIRTNTFSARLSAARQFGLLEMKDEGYILTGLARSLLHPVDPNDLAKLRRRALREAPLYVELLDRFGGKKVPEAAILANVLYHDYQIIASAKQVAADVFLESARSAGVLGEDGVLRPEGSPTTPDPTPAPAHATPEPSAPATGPNDGIRIEVKLWGADEGKTVRMRVPESMTSESFERLLQILRLQVRIE